MKRMTVITFLIALGLVLAACGAGNNSGQDANNGKNQTSNKAESKKVITVGTNPTFPPFEMEKNGNLVGFDIDLMRAIAEKEGMKVRFKSMQFDGLIPALQTNQIDATIAGMTITKQRMKTVNFSNAYYRAGQSILTMPDSEIKSFDDLKGKLIGTQRGTSSVSYMKNHGIPDSKIKQYDDISTAYNGLENGGVNAVVYDNPVNLNYIKKHKTKAKIVGKLLIGEYTGIAVNKKNTQLVKKLNNGLKELQQNGTYNKLFDKYFSGDKRGFIEKTLTPEDVATGD